MGTALDDAAIDELRSSVAAFHGEVGAGLLVAGPIPVQLVVPVIAPCIRIVPVSNLFENGDHFRFGLSMKECDAEIPNLAVCHYYNPPLLKRYLTI
jgi:hypothetical protein